MDINDIKAIEDISKKEKKSMPFAAFFILFVTPISLGIYYWLVDEIIFSYESVRPFSGFFIFSILACILSGIFYYIYQQYWNTYNTKIDDSNKIIENIINSDEGEKYLGKYFNKLKEEYIERKINNGELTEKEFIWHSNYICWCCGNKQKEEKINYTYTRERTVSWKDRGIRYSKTYTKTAIIPLCPKCYHSIIDNDNKAEKDKKIIKKVDIILSAIIIISIITYEIFYKKYFSNYYYYSNTSIIEDIITAILGLILLTGLCCSLGQIILYPLSYLISYPFLTAKNQTTKWNFDNIPRIKFFLKQKLPHE